MGVTIHWTGLEFDIRNWRILTQAQNLGPALFLADFKLALRACSSTASPLPLFLSLSPRGR